ncbi:hypothetical protein BASA50_008973 [Batrachochytrium salamandrivorans]|uniref:EF-hand domain-containing protein n=1 Tax=Batrachochytrium salamandrivorans TaxID=1357716 RepID=A0ABQ8F2J0_9FUNG|nr:hypothetical protein BASA50_008973 [Batrachochytrium salamandrivorans]KAH6601892.1 hypothetical protein BASA61_001692 [Batrachochytrium salamandrivorans]KAH9277243.1 hypothetical protein BASA83_000107 [Batrachochytrium salamandrivorans]
MRLAPIESRSSASHTRASRKRLRKYYSPSSLSPSLVSSSSFDTQPRQMQVQPLLLGTTPDVLLEPTNIVSALPLTTIQTFESTESTKLTGTTAAMVDGSVVEIPLSTFNFVPNQKTDADTLFLQWLAHTDASTFLDHELEAVDVNAARACHAHIVHGVQTLTQQVSGLNLQKSYKNISDLLPDTALHNTQSLAASSSTSTLASAAIHSNDTRFPSFLQMRRAKHGVDNTLGHSAVSIPKCDTTDSNANTTSDVFPASLETILSAAEDGSQYLGCDHDLSQSPLVYSDYTKLATQDREIYIPNDNVVSIDKFICLAVDPYTFDCKSDMTCNTRTLDLTPPTPHISTCISLVSEPNDLCTDTEQYDTTQGSTNGDALYNTTEVEKVPRHIVQGESEVIKKDSGVDLNSMQQRSTIEKFHYPYGKPLSQHVAISPELKSKLAAIFTGASDLALNVNNISLFERLFVDITMACGVPQYMSSVMYLRACNGSNGITHDRFIEFWESHLGKYPTRHAVIFGLLKDPENNYITPANIKKTVHYVTMNHPGLRFLDTYDHFQEYYIETIVVRVFYSKSKNWNQKMTFYEFEKSGFSECLEALECIDDVNKEVEFFSYQHFYVIYCKFWELNGDQTRTLNFDALRRYDESTMTDAIIKRVVSGAGKPSSGSRVSDAITYSEFVWFILSVEDKHTMAATEYWFRCLDLDGDGCISLYEMELFFKEQLQRMIASRMSDLWKFKDFVCSIFDLINPAEKNKITLRDLKKSTSAPQFFDMMFDLRKYDAHLRRIDASFRAHEDETYKKTSGTVAKLTDFQKFSVRAYFEFATNEKHAAAAKAVAEMRAYDTLQSTEGQIPENVPRITDDDDMDVLENDEVGYNVGVDVSLGFEVFMSMDVSEIDHVDDELDDISDADSIESTSTTESTLTTESTSPTESTSTTEMHTEMSNVEAIGVVMNSTGAIKTVESTITTDVDMEIEANEVKAEIDVLDVSVGNFQKEANSVHDGFTPVMNIEIDSTMDDLADQQK